MYKFRLPLDERRHHRSAGTNLALQSYRDYRVRGSSGFDYLAGYSANTTRPIYSRRYPKPPDGCLRWDSYLADRLLCFSPSAPGLPGSEYASFQIGNVGPDLGQSYIIDSFMAVVLGGVGQLVGTIVGALGLGVLAKLIEPFWGAVLAKIAILILIVLFIQKRPQGLLH